MNVVYLEILLKVGIAWIALYFKDWTHGTLGTRGTIGT